MRHGAGDGRHREESDRRRAGAARSSARRSPRVVRLEPARAAERDRLGDGARARRRRSPSIAADRSVRGVLVTGQRPRVQRRWRPEELRRSCSATRSASRSSSPTCTTIFGRLRALPVPVVALVNGVTAAGGLELVLNCDFALVARSARIGDAHLNFGQMGGGGVLTLLPRAIGRERARRADLLRALPRRRGGRRLGPRRTASSTTTACSTPGSRSPAGSPRRARSRSRTPRRC